MLLDTIDQVVLNLNKLLKCDPIQVSNFFTSTGSVKKGCAETVFEFSPSSFEDHVTMHTIGIINGIVAETVDTKIARRIAIKYKNNTPEIKYFYVQDI